ncbi:hypothetical protein [Neorhizobium sp. DAR64861/K0K2]|uniref:hypothetical protein n=1 Tax=unclassified Neorhizobium TaxID=2629175 RepID=UPI003D2C7BD7
MKGSIQSTCLAIVPTVRSMDEMDRSKKPDKKRGLTGRPLPFFARGLKAKFTSAQIRKSSRYAIVSEGLESQPVTDAEVRVLLLRLRDDLQGILEGETP